MFKKLALALSLFFLSYLSFGQADSSFNSSYYFNDRLPFLKGIIVKVNLAAVICGDLPFTAEKTFGDYFGIEAGAGILLPYYIPENNYMYYGQNPYLPKGQLDLGYSVYAIPKIYTGGYAPDDRYLGGMFRLRNYNLKNGDQVRYMDFAFVSGAQTLVSDRIAIDYSYGFGVRMRQTKDLAGRITSDGNEFDGLITPMAIKIGYMF